MFKKVLSIALAAMMMVSTAAIAASAAEADDEAVVAADSAAVGADSSEVGADSSEVGADASSDTGADASSNVGESASAQSLWFKVNHDVFKTYTSIYCYLYRTDGKEVTYTSASGRTVNTNTWGAKACLMTKADDDYWFFDLGAKGISLDSSAQYACIFAADWAAQTCDILLGEPCFGKEHAATCDGSQVENNVDSNKKSYVVAWQGVDTKKYAPPLQVTSIGNIIGTAIPNGDTEYTIFLKFLSDPGTAGVINAVKFNGKDHQHTIDDAANDPRFGLYQDDIEMAVNAANKTLAESKLKLEWDKSKSTAPAGSSGKAPSNGSGSSNNTNNNNTNTNNNNSTNTNTNTNGGTTTNGGGTGSNSVSSGQETTMFFVFGGVMLAAAGVVFLARKRRED